jgi:hypothetical protein
MQKGGFDSDSSYRNNKKYLDIKSLKAAEFQTHVHGGRRFLVHLPSPEQSEHLLQDETVIEKT